MITDARKIIGGGYVVPASTAMFEFMFQIVDTLKAQGKDIAVLMLSYGTFLPENLPPHSSKIVQLTEHTKISPRAVPIRDNSNKHPRCSTTYF